MSDNTAILAGYTREIIGTAGALSLHLFVKPDADLTDEFRAYDADECEFLRVSGWMFAWDEGASS